MESGTVEQVSAEQPAALAAATLCEAFQITAAERPDDVALRTPGDGVSITWKELGDRVRRIAAGLASLGVRRGDTVALMLVNRPEFNVADAGAMHLGATAFSVYNTCTREQVEFLFGNAQNRVVITERQFLPVVMAAKRNSPALEHVVVIDGEEDGTISLAQVEERGDAAFDFEAAWRAVEPDDVLTLIYTSGTTGPPKGVQLTHRNLMAEIRGVADRLPTKPGGRIASFLPSAHIADRWASHYQSLMVFGFTLTLPLGPAHDHPAPARGAAHRVGIGAAHLGEAQAGLEAQGVTDPAALPEEHKAAIREKLGLDQVSWLRRWRSAHAGRGARVLRRAGPADLRAVGHVGDFVVRHDQPTRPHQGRDVRHAAEGRRAEAGGRRRAAGARRDRDDGLPRRAREDTRGARPRRAGCTPATSLRSTTRAT